MPARVDLVGDPVVNTYEVGLEGSVASSSRAACDVTEPSYFGLWSSRMNRIILGGDPVL